MNALQRQSNNLHAHGSYIDDWRDDKGAIFERLVAISEDTAQQMVVEAIAGFDAYEHCRLGGLERRERRDIKTEFWMSPGNKEFVFLGNDNHKCMIGLYRHDFRMYIIRSDIERIRAYVNGGPYRLTDAAKELIWPKW